MIVINRSELVALEKDNMLRGKLSAASQFDLIKTTCNLEEVVKDSLYVQVCLKIFVDVVCGAYKKTYSVSKSLAAWCFCGLVKLMQNLNYHMTQSVPKWLMLFDASIVFGYIFEVYSLWLIYDIVWMSTRTTSGFEDKSGHFQSASSIDRHFLQSCFQNTSCIFFQFSILEKFLLLC